MNKILMLLIQKNNNVNEFLLLHNQRYFKEKHDFNTQKKIKRNTRYGVNFSSKKSQKINDRKDSNAEGTRNSSQRARSGHRSRRISYFSKNPTNNDDQNREDESINSTGDLQEIEENKEQFKDSKSINKHLKKMQQNVMKSIANPEEEYQKEFERKQKLRVKARQIYNEGKIY